MRPRPDVAGLQVEEISTLAALEALRPEWLALWRRAPAATPFQSPDWLIPWWRHIGEGELLALAVRDRTDGELVGLLPFYVYGQTGGGSRSLFPLGIATTDYLDALVLPGRAEAVMTQAFAHLVLRSNRFDACEWPQLRSGSSLLKAPAPEGWTDDISDGEACLVLPLPRSVEGLAEVVPPQMRQNLRTARRRAEREGELRWEIAGEQRLEEAFGALLRLHNARWAERGEEGVLASKAIQAAHREALPGLLRSGVLRLHSMRLDGEIVAVLYGLADPPGGTGRSVYYYLGGFDPRLAALSPGTLLVGHAIEEAVREGATAFDFLRGREAYKYRWGAREKATFRRRLRPPGRSKKGP